MKLLGLIWICFAAFPANLGICGWEKHQVCRKDIRSVCFLCFPVCILWFGLTGCWRYVKARLNAFCIFFFQLSFGKWFSRAGLNECLQSLVVSISSFFDMLIVPILWFVSRFMRHDLWDMTLYALVAELAVKLNYRTSNRYIFWMSVLFGFIPQIVKDTLSISHKY